MSIRSVSVKSLVSFITLASSTMMLNIAATTEGHATSESVNQTCAAITSPYLVPDNNTLDLTVAAGDTVTFSQAADAGEDAFLRLKTSLTRLATATPGNSASFTFLTAGEYKIRRSNGSSLTATCTLGGQVSEVQNSYSEAQIINQLSSLYDQMSSNARGSLNGDNSNSANGQGFNVNSNSFAYVRDDGTQTDFNLWTSGKYNQFDGSSFNGYTADLIAGIDYKISDNTLYGALIGYGKTDFDTLIGTTSGELKARSITAGLYAATNLENGLTLDALLAYTNTNYDIADGTTTANFEANRIGFSAGIYNSFKATNGWIIEPRAKLIIATEKQNAYTNSSNGSISARSITSGQIALGPKIYFDHDGSFSPWASLDAEYDFTSATTISSSVIRSNGNFSVRPAAGFDYKMDENTRITFDADVGGLGSNAYTSYGLAVELNKQF